MSESSGRDDSGFELTYIQDGKEHTRRVSREQLLTEGWSELAIDGAQHMRHSTKAEVLLEMYSQTAPEAVKALNAFSSALEHFGLDSHSETPRLGLFPNRRSRQQFRDRLGLGEDGSEVLSGVAWESFFAGMTVGMDNPAITEETIIKLLQAHKRRIQDEIRTQRAESGGKGGKARSEKSKPLKDWAIERAKSMRGTAKEKARRLMLEVPVELANLSDDPERMMYLAILDAEKTKKKKQQ